MDQDLSFSASYELNATPAQLYALVGVDFVPINKDVTLAINQRSGHETLLMPEIASSLRRCDRFRTLEEHTGYLCSVIDGLQGAEGDVLATLQSLAQSGILTSAAEITDPLTKAPRLALAPTRVFIITCDRPAGLGRLLDSMRQSAGLEHHASIIVIDDSRDEANVAQNRREVELFNQQSPKPAQHMGHAEIRELIDVIGSALPQHKDALGFVLDRDRFAGQATYSISRTVCQMMSVGYRAIVLDDDVVCQAMFAPEPGQGACFTAESQAWHYPTVDAMFDAVKEAPFSPLQAHAQTVGLPVAQALQTWKLPLNASTLTGASAGLLRPLTARSRVLISQNGSMGDNGAGNAHWALNIGRDSVERFLAAPGSLNERFSSRNVWFGPSTPALYKMTRLSPISGIDNTELLPPYFPIYRGEDELFGAMVEHIHPQHYVLGMPWVVPHLPLDSRSDRNLEGSPVKLGPMTVFNRVLTDTTDYRGQQSAEDRLAGIASGLRRFASASDSELLGRYRAESTLVLADQLRQVEKQMANTADIQNDEWQQYLRRCGQQIFDAISKPTQSGTALEPAALPMWREHASNFAATLEAWPRVREVCKEIEWD